MSNKDIENSIKSAFSKTAPNVLVSVLEQCSEKKGVVINMTENKRRTPTLRIICIAAVIALVTMISTVTAVGLSNLIDKKCALGNAMTYAVTSCEDDEVRNDLAYYVLSAMSYDESVEEGEVRFGFSSFKPVYHVTFSVGGYCFKAVVDARTGVVISCKSEVDEGWEAHLNQDITGDTSSYFFAGSKIYDIISEHLTFKDVNAAREQGLITVAVGDVTLSEARDIATSYALGQDGISEIEHCNYDIITYSVENYLTDPMTYIVQCVHGGYIYEYSVDSVTGEVKELCVVDDMYFDPEQSQSTKHKHTHNSEVIGSDRAKLIARQAYEELGYSLDGCHGYSFYYQDDELLEALGYSKPFYGVHINKEGHQVDFNINAYTGEVLSVQESSAEETQIGNSSSDGIQIPSTEALEGLISEAEACAAALEEAQVLENDLTKRSIKLKDDGHGHSIYEISFATKDGSSFDYEIYAVDGSIISYSKALK